MKSNAARRRQRCKKRKQKKITTPTLKPFLFIRSSFPLSISLSRSLSLARVLSIVKNDDDDDDDHITGMLLWAYLLYLQIKVLAYVWVWKAYDEYTLLSYLTFTEIKSASLTISLFWIYEWSEKHSSEVFKYTSEYIKQGRSVPFNCNYLFRLGIFSIFL